MSNSNININFSQSYRAYYMIEKKHQI